MRTSTFAPVLVLALATLAGCAAETSSGASEADMTALPAAAAPAAGSAQVTVVPVKKTEGKCSVDSSQITVKLPNAVAAKAINEALKEDFASMLDPKECAETAFNLEGGQTAAFNQGGLLTVTIGQSSFMEGAAHPAHSFQVKNFDLATGKVIELADALDAEGLRILADNCTKVLAEGEIDEMVKEACESEVKPSEFGTPSWAIEASGIRLHPQGFPHAAFVMTAEGAAATWAQLKGHVRHPAIAALAPR